MFLNCNGLMQCHFTEIMECKFVNKVKFMNTFSFQILNSVAGPVMSKFTTAFRELGTYKELLRSQVKSILCH